MKKYYHYHYKVKWYAEIIEQDVCYSSEKDNEHEITDFMRKDLQETYENGKIIFFGLTKITDEKGRSL